MESKSGAIRLRPAANGIDKLPPCPFEHRKRPVERAFFLAPRCSALSGLGAAGSLRRRRGDGRRSRGTDFRRRRTWRPGFRRRRRRKRRRRRELGHRRGRQRGRRHGCGIRACVGRGRRCRRARAFRWRFLFRWRRRRSDGRQSRCGLTLIRFGRLAACTFTGRKLAFQPLVLLHQASDFDLVGGPIIGKSDAGPARAAPGANRHVARPAIEPQKFLAPGHQRIAAIAVIGHRALGRSRDRRNNQHGKRASACPHEVAPPVCDRSQMTSSQASGGHYRSTNSAAGGRSLALSPGAFSVSVSAVRGIKHAKQVKPSGEMLGTACQASAVFCIRRYISIR